MKPTLTVIILTKDESHNIVECMESVVWADEILVFDSGSSDNTLALAVEAGARVEEAPSWSGFGKQRQAAQERASSDWILMLDADERVTPELKASIEKAVARDERSIAYAVNRASYFFGRFIRHSGWYPDRILRLYHNSEYRYDDAEVHEQLVCSAKNVVNLSGDLLHYTCTDYQTFVAKSLRYANDWARERYRRGKRATLFSASSHAAGCFLRKYLLQRGFLDGRHGFLLAVLASYYVFNKYAALWTLQSDQNQ